MKRARNASIQLFLLLIVPVSLLFALLALWSISVHRSAMRQVAGEQDSRVALATAAIVHQSLVQRQMALHSIGMQLEHEGEIDLATAAAPYTYLFPDGLALVDSLGKPLEAIGQADFWADQAVIGLAAALAQSGHTVSAVVDHPKTAVPLALMGEPIGERGYAHLLQQGQTAQGEVWLVSSLAPRTLSQEAVQAIFSEGDNHETGVVDGGGKLIFQSPSDVMIEGEWLRPIEPSSPQEATYFVDESSNVVAYAKIPTADWTLVTVEPGHSPSSPVQSLAEYGSLLLVPMLLVSAIALLFVDRSIVTPLQELARQATALGAGDFGAIRKPVGGVGEIRQLQDELVHMAQKVEAAQVSLRSYLEALASGQEEERRRLARELHDDTIQSLIVLNQKVQCVRGQRNGTFEGELADIEQLSDELVGNLRRLIRNLRPTYLEDLGLVPALQMLAAECEERFGIPISFETIGTVAELKAETTLALYRIAQEALNNVAQHAAARSAAVYLTFTGEKVLLVVEDDGLGFDVPESLSGLATQHHFGLVGMQERVERLGGRLKLRSQRGEGTMVKVSLPIHEQAFSG